MRYDLFVQAKATLNIRSELMKLLPYGKVEGHEYVAINPTRCDGKLGSFKVNMISGKWADFATGDKGGDLISLYAYLNKLSYYDAARLILDNMMDYPRHYANPTNQSHTNTKEYKCYRYINTILQECVNAKNSLVENYLKTRGIIGNIPRSILYHPSLYHAPTKSFYPAMVATVYTQSSDKVIGLHRTYLKRDGSGKANIEPNKMMLGQTKGGAVQFGTLGTKLVLTEGIETAMSVYIATGLAVWATLSTTGMQNIKLPPPNSCEIIIAADGDEAGKNAAYVTAKRLMAAGYSVRLALPPEKQDFNDLLQGL